MRGATRNQTQGLCHTNVMLSSSLKILQVNLNRSGPATESALQTAIELGADLIVVQEPWVTRDYTRSIAHQSFTQILPPGNGLRPRTLVYVSKALRPLVSLATTSPNDPDLLVVDIQEGRSAKVQLINVYNEDDQAGEGPRTLERCLFRRQLSSNTLLLGDFNTHHPWWDPLAQESPGAGQLIEWLEQRDLELLNSPGTGTFFRPNLARESVLDLSFATPLLANKIQDWQVLPDLGSDHNGILFSITGTNTVWVDNPVHPTNFNTRLANWEHFTTSLKSNIAEGVVLNSNELGNLPPNWENQLGILEDNTPTTALLDAAASELTDAITRAAIASIPTIKPGARAKPWWSEDLKSLRKAMMQRQRGISGDPDTKNLYLQARNTYFQAIKRAKWDYWNQFLENEDPKSIFKAMGYTSDKRVERTPPIQSSPTRLEDTFQGKCSAFRDTLFPYPPSAPKPNWTNYQPSTSWDWPSLSRAELEDACSAKIKGKTPGPDSITQEIILHAYRAIPDIFYRLYSSLVNIGYHPVCWRQATGAILKKEGKPDYTAPKAYRVISLLNCLGKVSERILAQRLGYLAETTHLLHPSQMGGRLKKSAIDAALLLTNEVETNRRLKRKTTTLFLDIKGAFDHVAKNQLLGILQKLQLPGNLVAWTSSFLSNRTLRLSFDGQTEKFSKIETGIPQGSPISPILFLIYIRELFPRLAAKVLSYIDDISLTVASTSLKKNTRILEREVAKLYELGAKNAIQFDLAKTELMHFSTGKQAKITTLKLPNGEIVEPKEVVRWLGIWFDPGLTFKQHVATRASQARSAFQRMARLANTERGLSPKAIRQLYIACITSIADYGSVIWWRGQAQFKKPLQALQNLALRKILGVFKTAPILPMEVEASLLPPSIRLDKNIQQFSLRTHKLAPSHPINKELARIDQVSRARPTQLERIRDSIKDLADTGALEQIEHFKFPPWRRSAPYRVEISQQPKDEAALTHLTQLQEESSSDIFRIYTDASSMPDSLGVGVGFAVLCQGRVTHQDKTNLGTDQLVYDGELEGATRALEYAGRVAQPGRQFKVYSDNQAGLYRLQTTSDNPGQACQIRAIKAANQIAEKGATVSIHWVPGHTDIPGNELADSLAKEASKEAPQLQETSFAFLGLKIKQTSSSNWLALLRKSLQGPRLNHSTYSRNFPWRLSSKIQLPKGTKRELASAFYQLKIGHGYLKSYLHRFNHSANDKCKCGRRETPEHLLLSCPELKSARDKLKNEMKGIKLSLSTLLHTKIGIETTLGFLRETRIATRRWRLERQTEEEEETEVEEE